MTADGKIATANRAISSFGSEHDHEHLLELRATADAVMAGARTVDLNSINLGPGPLKFRRIRLRRGLVEYNLRIIVSGSGTINPHAEIFKHRFAESPTQLNRTLNSIATTLPLSRPVATLSSARSGGEDGERGCSTAFSKSPIIILTTERASASALRRLRGLADAVKVCGKTEINFRAALRWLRSRWGVKRLLCEGGGELNDALFRAGLVDELHLTVCPKIFGGRTASTIADGLGMPKLATATALKLKSSRRIGDEMFLVFERA